MILYSIASLTKTKSPLCLYCRAAVLQKCFSSQDLENKYTDEQKTRILHVINDSDAKVLSGYDIAKIRLKKFSQWRESNGQVKTISDMELVEGFSQRIAKKLFDSILEGPMKKEANISNKIKGQILHPHLSDAVRQSCKSVLSVYVTVNSVCWTLIHRSGYEVTEWKYHGIDYPEGKRSQISDIMEISWQITQQLPTADIYVMNAEATTLRAGGSDPNNPKVIAVNLQKSQMIAMIVALINARSNSNSVLEDVNGEKENNFKHTVYFLRPTLPYRLYGTLVGNEKVSTEQTIEMLLQDITEMCPDNSHVYISEQLKSMFRNVKDLQKDMLGHCLLLGLTFMDLCIYRNQKRINTLIKQGE